MALIVSEDIKTRAEATARRSVMDFSVVSTILARPCSSVWVRSLIVSKRNLNAKGRKGPRKGREGRLEFVDYSSDPIFHVNHVKVQQERETKIGKSEIR